jgi:large subunit ribosomal protein L4
MGSIRSVQRKGSGAAHGPHPKDWSFKVNKKVKKLAMASALASKFAQGNLMIVDGLADIEAKTKIATEISTKYNWNDGGVLIIGGQKPPINLKLATRNVPHIDLRSDTGLSVYNVLRRKYLVIAKETLEVLDKHVPL